MSNTWPNNSRGVKIRTPGGNKEGQLQSSDLSRNLPRQMSTGSTRGTQTVGYGNTKIDGTNNTISIENPLTNVSISIGVIQGSTNDTGVGLSITDDNGFVLFKLDGQTWYWYDSTTEKNIMQVGLLPDGSFGQVNVKPGYNVEDAFTG